MTIQDIVFDSEGLAEKLLTCHTLGHLEIKEALQSWCRGCRLGW